MVKYSVGLDFGTHQTKVCFQNMEANPHTIELIRFDDKLFLPSIVQVNADNTLNYGYSHEINLSSKTKINKGKVLDKQYTNGSNRGHTMENYTNIAPPLADVSLEKSNSKRQKDKSAFGNWKRKLIRLNEKALRSNKDKKDTEENFEITDNQNYIEPKNSETEKRITQKLFDIRYFKMPNFFAKEYRERYNRQYSIHYFDASVLYLTNILFLIEKQIGNDYTIQMGVPTDTQHNGEKNKFIGKKMFVYAFELKHTIGNYKDFIHMKLDGLKTLLNEISLNSEEITLKADEVYYIGIIPEAYAALSLLTRMERITRGMYLFVDIGGGSTDVSFFTISDNKEPLIHGGYSYAKGLNNLFESSANRQGSKPTLQDIIKNHINQRIDNDVKNRFLNDIKNILENLFAINIQKALNRHQIHHISEIKKRFYKACKDQSIIYSGGGSYMESILPVMNEIFTDKHSIDFSIIENLNLVMLNDVEDLTKELKIIVNAIGLSIPVIDEDEAYIDFSELDTWNALKEVDEELNTTRYVRYDNSDMD